jgi:hypothetical protein
MKSFCITTVKKCRSSYWKFFIMEKNQHMSSKAHVTYAQGRGDNNLFYSICHSMDLSLYILKF